MALSKKAKEAIRRAVTEDKAADELIAALEAAADEQAAFASDLSVANVGSTDGSGGAGDAALAADVDSRFNDVEAKVNDILDKLQAAGLMASS